MMALYIAMVHDTLMIFSDIRFYVADKKIAFSHPNINVCDVPSQTPNTELDGNNAVFQGD